MGVQRIPYFHLWIEQTKEGVRIPSRDSYLKNSSYKNIEKQKIYIIIIIISE